MNLDIPIPFETWRAGLAPSNIRTLTFQQDVFFFSLTSSFWLWLSIKFWRSRLLWYLSLCGLLFSSWSFINLTFFSVIGSSASYGTFGINFSSRACKVTSWQSYLTQKLSALELDLACSVLNGALGLLFSFQVTLKSIMFAGCIVLIQHNPLSKSIFVPY